MKSIATLAVLCASAVAIAAVEGVTLPPEWTAETTGVAEGVELHYSPDLRCRIAAVSSEVDGVYSEQLWSALREVAPEHQLSIADGDEPVRFNRGEFVGAIRLRQLATDRSTWQLQACFYRKRNQHVCKPICQKLLA